jgi:hypothetical protein
MHLSCTSANCCILLLLLLRLAGTPSGYATALLM